jgi:N4-gp56 family major capsid protein
MASTYFDTTNALAKKAWDEKLFRDVEKSAFFKKFMSEKKDSPVYVKSDLEAGSGDKVTMGLRMRLTGAGVEDGAILEGNEESLTTYDYSLSLKQYRHAARAKGGISAQRVPWDVAEECGDAIKVWGSEKVDKLIFDAYFGAATKIIYRASGDGSLTSGSVLATVDAAISSATNQVITPKVIAAMYAWAKDGGNRAYVPLRPLMDQGRAFYILLIDPGTAFDLRNDSTYMQAQREAQERGKENPLFTGALGVWSGVVIHEHENVAASGTVGHGILLGAQSSCFAWGKRPKTVWKTFDYDNETGAAIDMTCRAGKTQFGSKDFGSVMAAFYRTNVSAL